MKKRILVTGSNGYIGSNLIYTLADLHPNATIVGVDCDIYGQAHADAKRCLQKIPNVTLVREDVSVIENMESLYKSADIIFPLAAIVGAPACDKVPDIAWQVNYDAIASMVNCLEPHQHVIFPNTNSGYGIGGDSYCTEESPLNPISIYGKSKCAAEQAIMSSNAKWTVFRLATVFGLSLRMRVDLLVNTFVLQILRDKHIKIYEPEARRNFINIADVCENFIYAAEHGITGLYNLGDDNLNMSKADLAEELFTLLNIPPSIEIGTEEDPDKRDYVVSNRKMQEAGFSCTNPLVLAVQELQEWYNNVTYEKASYCRNI